MVSFGRFYVQRWNGIFGKWHHAVDFVYICTHATVWSSTHANKVSVADESASLFLKDDIVADFDGNYYLWVLFLHGGVKYVARG
jgi:hypothetical protein